MFSAQLLDNFNETYWMYAEELVKCGFFESLIMRFKYGFLREKKEDIEYQ